MSTQRPNNSNQKSEGIQLSLFDTSSYSDCSNKNKLNSTEILENNNLPKKTSANVLDKKTKYESTDKFKPH